MESKQPFSTGDNNYKTIVMIDDDGKEVEFAVMDVTEYKGAKYLLVVEPDTVDDDESEATILKQFADIGDDVIYEIVSDDDEFDAVAAVFGENNDEFDIEI